MSSQRKTKRVVNALQDVDDLTYLITGRRIKNLVQRGLDLFGEDVKRKVVGEKPKSEDPDDPYNVLEVRQNASDLVIKAAYRSLMKRYHPEGHQPDEEMAKRVNNAFDSICKQRGMKL